MLDDGKFGYLIIGGARAQAQHFITSAFRMPQNKFHRVLPGVLWHVAATFSGDLWCEMDGVAGADVNPGAKSSSAVKTWCFAQNMWYIWNTNSLGISKYGDGLRLVQLVATHHIQTFHGDLWPGSTWTRVLATSLGDLAKGRASEGAFGNVCLTVLETSLLAGNPLI